MTASPAAQPSRPRHMRVVAIHGPELLVVAWFLFMASASAWLPAYNGNIDSSDRWRLIVVYLVIAVIAEVAMRSRVGTQREAILASLPALGLLAVAAVVGVVAGLTADGRGSPLYLYFGIALWTSWAALVLSTALLSRVRWDRLGLGLTVIVTVVGALMAAAQID